MSMCRTCGVEDICCLMMDPKNGLSDGNFHCLDCWRKCTGGLPTTQCIQLPAICSQCNMKGPLFMWDPYDKWSDLHFYCKNCWALRGCDLPGKSLMTWLGKLELQHVASKFANHNTHSPLSNVYVTDFGFPKSGMLVHQTFQALSSCLETYGAHVVNNIDATCKRSTILEQLGLAIDDKIAMVVWGSPHPNSFTDLLAGSDLNYANGNNAYKQAAFDMLVSKWPECKCYMPAPKYYNLPGAVPLVVSSACGLQYFPMASSESSYQRLCKEEDAMVVCNSPEWSKVDLRSEVQQVLENNDGKIIFFGEYICTLSFFCCVPR